MLIQLRLKFYKERDLNIRRQKAGYWVEMADLNCDGLFKQIVPEMTGFNYDKVAELILEAQALSHVIKAVVFNILLY